MKRVQSLTDVFAAAGTLKPQGTMDHDVGQGWLTELRRMAQHLVTKSDKATIVNAVRTFTELSWFLLERQRPFPPEELDLRSFVSIGTAGPVRAVNSLRWISKNGLLRWPVDNVGQVQLSTSRKVRRNCQAVVVEPPMMARLEAAIIEQHRLGNENWRRLLGSLVANGCLRYRRISLSTPTKLKLTLSSIYAHCARGKQTHNRKAWVAPARFENGFSWAEFWMKDYTSLPYDASLKSGFCFEDNGQPYTISEVQQGARDIFSGLVGPLDALTTYSFRRVLPTVANMLNFTGPERLALGDWTDKDTGAAAMPSHYASAKPAQAVKSKHRAYNAVKLLESYERWEMAPYGALEQVDVLAKQRTNKAVGQDSTAVLWEIPPDAEKLSQHFRLAAELTAAAAKVRSKPPSNHPAMPATHGAYVLTQTMKSGALLRTSYNVGSCPRATLVCSGFADGPGLWGQASSLRVLGQASHDSEEVQGASYRGSSSIWIY